MSLLIYLMRWLFSGVYLAVPGFTTGYLALPVALACAFELWMMRGRPHPIEINPHDLTALKDTR